MPKSSFGSRGVARGGDIMEEMREVSCVFVGRCFMDQSLLNTRYSYKI